MKRQRVIVIMIDFHLTQINVWRLIISAALWDEMIDLEGPVQRRLLHKCANSFVFSPQNNNNWILIRSALFLDDMIDLLQSWKRPVQRRRHHKCVVDISIFFPAFKVYLGQGCICGVQWNIFALSFAVYVTNAVKESSIDPLMMMTTMYTFSELR